MTPLDFLFCTLATWYLSHALTALEGPWRLFERLRGVTTLQGVLGCIYCLSFWVALGFYLGIMYPDYQRIYLEVPAIAGASLMLRSYTGAGLHGD